MNPCHPFHRPPVPPYGRGRAALVAALALLWLTPGHAQTADAAPGIGLTTALQTFAALAAILALFIGTAWLLRRLNGGRGPAGGGPMRVVGGLSLGPRERIVLVEIEDTWLVVGIAPGQMRTLHTMPKGEPPVPDGGDGQFAHWLRRFREIPKNAEN
ncbi:MAG: flagellar biosynthetic protein FliO [Rhodocyclaceae bacterium]|nr:flagellar biosynthetic protein FliO [Rhodocyclaceae bacterium]